MWPADDSPRPAGYRRPTVLSLYQVRGARRSRGEVPRIRLAARGFEAFELFLGILLLMGGTLSRAHPSGCLTERARRPAGPAAERPVEAGNLREAEQVRDLPDGVVGALEVPGRKLAPRLVEQHFEARPRPHQAPVERTRAQCEPMRDLHLRRPA